MIDVSKVISDSIYCAIKEVDSKVKRNDEILFDLLKKIIFDGFENHLGWSVKNQISKLYSEQDLDLDKSFGSISRQSENDPQH